MRRQQEAGGVNIKRRKRRKWQQDATEDGRKRVKQQEQ